MKIFSYSFGFDDQDTSVALVVPILHHKAVKVMGQNLEYMAMILCKYAVSHAGST